MLYVVAKSARDAHFIATDHVHRTTGIGWIKILSVTPTAPLPEGWVKPPGKIEQKNDLSSRNRRAEDAAHKELIDRGAELAVAEDRDGETRSGYWMPGDGDGKGYGDFLGKTASAALEAIRG